MGDEAYDVTPLTAFEKVCAGFTLLFVTVFTVLVAAALLGCANTPSGVRVVATSVSATNLGDINWDEYKVPVFSIYTGPRTTVWVNRNYAALKKVSASGSVTNDVSALGIYESKEQKRTQIDLEFCEGTNDVEVVVEEG